MSYCNYCYLILQHEREKGSIYLHSIDDLTLIAGHASLGFEIVDDVPDVDIVLGSLKNILNILLGYVTF